MCFPKLHLLLCTGFDLVPMKYVLQLYMRASHCAPFNETSLDCFTARGVKYLFPVQVKTFQPIYDGKDVIAQARTGTGKTFSFALPLVEKLQSVSQDGRRGRSPKVSYCLRVNTKTLEQGRCQKRFCNRFGDVLGPSFPHVDQISHAQVNSVKFLATLQ